MCDAIFIVNTQQTFKKRIDGHFYDLLRLLKNGHKHDWFDDHFEQHIKSTTSCTDLRKYMPFKVVMQINLIGAMKTFTKLNCNICMEEHLTILKKLCGKHITIMNKNLEIYGSCRHKITFHRFCLSTEYTVFKGWKG